MNRLRNIVSRRFGQSNGEHTVGDDLARSEELVLVDELARSEQVIPPEQVAYGRMKLHIFRQKTGLKRTGIVASFYSVRLRRTTTRVYHFTAKGPVMHSPGKDAGQIPDAYDDFVILHKGCLYMEFQKISKDIESVSPCECSLHKNNCKDCCSRLLDFLEAQGVCLEKSRKEILMFMGHITTLPTKRIGATAAAIAAVTTPAFIVGGPVGLLVVTTTYFAAFLVRRRFTQRRTASDDV